jgi:hypothetical protein
MEQEVTAMVLDWVNPATFVMKTYKEIGGAFAELRKKILGTRARIAVTGMEGVGKTVLLHALTGEDQQLDYRKPGRSQAKESRQVKAAGRKLLLVAVPGQPAHPRRLTLDELFRGPKPVDGVIHVVGGGFASIREPFVVRSMIEDSGIDTIEKFREQQRKGEREDLIETCQAIRDSHRKHHAPKWLVVAVDKIDLYHDTIMDEEDRYAPTSKHGLPKLLHELARQVGTDFFRWTAMPVCGRLEAFEWNGQTRPSQIDEDMRQRYLAQFLTELGAYCQ